MHWISFKRTWNTISSFGQLETSTVQFLQERSLGWSEHHQDMGLALDVLISDLSIFNQNHERMLP